MPTRSRPTRRRFLAAAALTGVLAGCTGRLPGDLLEDGGDPAAVLAARPPATPPAGAPPPGTTPLGLESRRDPLLHLPPGLVPGRPAPLVVTLHGAGGDAEGGLALLRAQADERGLLLLGPASRGSTWDAVGGDHGPDAALLDRALDRVFGLVAVDAGQVAVAGFSDGASYALGLGLANGGLFGRVVAFSPGFVPRGPRSSPADGRPRVFVSHGDADDVLPVDATSRRIVPRLTDEGYDVTYREFAGAHVVPPEVAAEAADWLGWTGPR
ncbi:alpha/beta hydrolase [Modestobacter sp. URMC 112]